MSLGLHVGRSASADEAGARFHQHAVLAADRRDVLFIGEDRGSSGWIAKQGTRSQLTGWRIAVSLGARRVTVYRHGRAIGRFAAVVGKPSTPTPTGSFFVEETLQMTTSEPGGPYALALSARSNAL